MVFYALLEIAFPNSDLPSFKTDTLPDLELCLLEHQCSSDKFEDIFAQMISKGDFFDKNFNYFIYINFYIIIFSPLYWF